MYYHSKQPKQEFSFFFVIVEEFCIEWFEIITFSLKNTQFFKNLMSCASSCNLQPKYKSCVTLRQYRTQMLDLYNKNKSLQSLPAAMSLYCQEICEICFCFYLISICFTNAEISLSSNGFIIYFRTLARNRKSLLSCELSYCDWSCLGYFVWYD
ncbi:Hypothetical_protein [Hexamita inflata]|uniref:Hypothetical_protein n=1 Tax=Hexamita inflata TaxID=28002 RepID=A0ABP1H0L0_9EUKA